MAEYESSQDGLNNGHSPKTETALLELYRLVAIFLASRNFASLTTSTGERFDPMFTLQGCEEDEFTRLLLTLAITARVLDDRKGMDPTVRATARCGTLIGNRANPSVKKLTLREACNKIIHAKKIRPVVKENRKRQKYMEPRIHLFGDLNGIEWEATLEVLPFAKEYVSFLRNF